ncbi:MAG TPA: alpha-2-macroglobulin family protein [Terriglobales bacterium]|nr:alpha-2-macroglobulin family protein [Terriglobales bacterium]
MLRFRVLLAVVAIVFFCRTIPAQTIEVNEKATRIELHDAGSQLIFPVRNLSSETVQAHLGIEILGSDGKVRGKTEEQEAISPGANRITVPFSFWTDTADMQTRDAPWERLRYTFEFQDAKLAPVSGVVAIAQITPQLFELKTWRPQYVLGDSVYRVRVHTQHPVTQQPVAGVQVEGKLDFHDDKETVLHSKAVTDKSGNAVLTFSIPDNQPANGPELSVIATRGGFQREISPDVDLLYLGNALITTDKPIYQPGQVLHMRALLVADSKRVKANANVIVTITNPDPDDTVIFRETLQSSRFGIVHADWQIPENQQRGDYRIQVVPADGDDAHHWRAEVFVTISRYELPNFVVNVKPDKSYYLPGQNAEVEVRGDYLFGKAVKHGHVRVVREDNHRWSYTEQKWETEEGDEYKGELDSSGHFTAHINLKKEEDDLSGDDYARFNDLHFAAYVTDATTQRTEQRRFDLRITPYAIHVYYIPSGGQHEDLPLNFYLSAQYADGKPCQCEIAIQRYFQKNTVAEQQEQYSPLTKITTNRYGLARVVGLKLPQLEEDSSDLGLMLEARDSHGVFGRHQERTSSQDEDVIRISADKALYREGEPVSIQIESSLKTTALVVEVLSHSKLIETEVVHLRNGRAWLTIPYSSQFQDDVQITAYDMSNSSYGYWGLPFGSRTVLYPKKHELNLSVRLGKAVFRPGEDAQADLHVQGPNGENVEGALALAITDKAVDARARTEQDFSSGGNFWSGYGYWFDREDIAGFRRSDLDKVDVSEPVPADLDLLAEVLLRNESSWEGRPNTDTSGEMENPASVFQAEIHSRILSIATALNQRVEKDRTYPRDEETLRRLLADAGLKREEIRDPWGTAYRARFYSEREFDKMVFVSAGPDKTFGTADDFEVEPISWPYFRSYGEAIDRTAEQYQQHAGKCIVDEATLKSELRNQGIDWGKVRDRWGQPYRLEFGIERRLCTIGIISGGPDKVYRSKAYYDYDDFRLWTSRVDYLGDLEAQIRTAIANYYRDTSIFPEKEDDLAKALSAAGLDMNSNKMRDPWGMPYYPVFEQNAIYTDRILVKVASGSRQEQSKPVTTHLMTVRLRSSGSDKVKGDADDFELVQFSTTVSEQSANDVVPQPVQGKDKVVFTDETGAIAGMATDPSGAIVANAVVTAVSDTTGVEFRATTDAQGQYSLTSLPPGTYVLRCNSPGFKLQQVNGVVVLAKSVTHIDMTLDVGTTAETVEVTAAALQTNTMISAAMADVKKAPLPGRKAAELAAINPGVMASPISTPRLREYFPETLLWQPELITDKSGHSHLKFKLADNITSWKLSVLASDANGQMGSAEKEFTAFQPFFADHDPPPVLTQNDEISLPVVLRNYLNKPQRVNVEMKTEPWFTLLGAASQHADVPAGDSTNAIFPFRAITAIHDGKQRVTAIGSDASDAIERKVSVHPDGEEKVITQSQIFSNHAQFSAALPDSVIPGSVHAELKIYPNLMAHVMEAIEGSLERPYGCGEQTISSTYPNLLVLRAYKAQGIEGPNAALARHFLQTGYNRLLSYRSGDGFAYWTKEEPDFALTAYAIQFLNDAKEFIAVDEGVISAAQLWLLQQQGKNGAWISTYTFANDDYKTWYERSTTSYVTRILAQTLSDEEKKQTPSPTNLLGHLHSAFDYLDKHVQDTDEPYFIANYALVASALGEQTAAAQARTRLQSLVHKRDGEAYWELQRNTPFYGWGTAGQVETTALVLRALAQDENHANPLLFDGLRFLLQEKDRYGVWYSGQATVNVLKTLIDLTDISGAINKGENPAEIKVNGKTAKTITIPSGKEIVSPIIVDLSEFFSPGEDQVELTGTSDAARSSAQLVSTYYVPWSASTAGKGMDEKHGDSDILHLSVHYDKTEARIGEEIHCQVDVERIGFRGYGMMLAEIGLPPAADVDRESLDKAIENAGWSLNHYDVLPDRLVAYVWPHYGGGATHFEFAFRPRMGEVAQTAPSLLYDYYNPEARAVVEPTKFVIH